MTDTESSPPSVSMFENGPIQVEGSVPLSRRRIVTTEKGEPITYDTYAELAPEERYFLCRCGGSGNKPFCDGTHNKIGFVSDEVESAGYDEGATSIGGTSVTVYDNRSICAHAGFCGTTVSNVWKMAPKSDDDTVIRSQVVSMVERCPSGALTYRLEGDDVANEPSLPSEIAVLADGPLHVTGGIPIEGASVSVENRNRVVLCRCGASSIKPLCDGSHAEAGFEDS